MSPTSEKYSHGSKVFARFKPKKLDTLRECMVPLIGRTFEYEFVGTSMDDEAYPGQSRWWMARHHDPEVPEECRGRWCPLEDLEIIEPSPMCPPPPASKPTND